MEKLATEKIVKVFARRRVVNEVSLEVNRGEVVGILGPNGAGKTTSFYMIVGLVSPDSGRVLIDEKEITSWPMYMRARQCIGYLAQEPSIFRRLSVRDNIRAILQFMKLNRKEIDDRADELMSELNILHLSDNVAYSLSGGERRRAEIARSLATEPAFMLLDEPFAGVDPIAVADIQEIVRHLKRKGLGVIITDHNVRETLNITDRSYIINQGQILIAGSAEEIAQSEVARKIYLGEKFRL
ncbi:MAG: LPS export ABC transporter ATP-binding protein [Candidatus Wallbacteria bacterium]|nr:LPS export ABC transporter ATP-binding protein [Candidatus Wallbacteria bacterium]